MPCIDTVQGFSFCPAAYQLHTRVYSVFSAVHAIIPQQRQNRLQGFTGTFPLILNHSSAHNTAATQAAYTPPATRWGHTVKRSTSADTRYHRHAGRCTAQHSRPIIIRYIRVQRCAPVVDPCQTVQHIADHASGGGLLLSCADCRQVLTHCQQYRPCAPTEGVNVSTCTGSARRLAIWHRSAVRAHPPPGRAVQQRGRGGRRRLVAASLFGLSPDSQ